MGIDDASEASSASRRTCSCNPSRSLVESDCCCAGASPQKRASIVMTSSCAGVRWIRCIGDRDPNVSSRISLTFALCLCCLDGAAPRWCIGSEEGDSDLRNEGRSKTWRDSARALRIVYRYSAPLELPYVDSWDCWGSRHGVVGTVLIAVDRLSSAGDDVADDNDDG